MKTVASKSRSPMSYLSPFKKEIAAAALLIALDVLAEVTQPRLMAKIVSEGIEGGSMPSILKTGGLMLLLAVLSVLCGIGNARNSAKAGVGFATALRGGLFAKVQTFSFANIDHFSTASLSTRLTNDVTLLQNTSVMSLRILVRAPLMLGGALIMAITYNARLAMILAVAMPILIISLAVILSIAGKRFDRMQKSVDGLNATVQESLINVRVVKSFVREDHEREKFSAANSNLMNASLSAMNLIITNMPLMMLLMNACIVAVVWLGGNQVINGEIDVAAVSAFITYITQVLISLMMLSMMFVMLSRATASYRRINEVLQYESGDISPENGLSAEGIRGDVEFRSVSFKYNREQDEDVLKDISFSASAGEVVAIIGGTGSGKSSLVQLISRLYDVTGGQVLVDGVDVREYDLESLRGAVGMVLQKNTLFSGTIRDNLRWGDPDATDAEIEAAAAAAQADDFIKSFPDGYDTWVEQGGVNLSGGQKQRLCIARAILKKPPILILDDSTSAVDTATEKRIRASFDRELRDTTTFIIAQRITSVMDADKILVIDNGEICACGTHSELMESSEEYREIYYSQQQKEATA